MSQPDPLYAFEKLSEAVYELATGAERVQERLVEAAIYLIRIRPVDISDEDLRHLLVALYALALTRLAGLRLFDIKCAWFNEEEYCEFFPRALLAHQN